MAASKHAPGTFCWFECGSTNAARARAFYTQVFGWDATEVPMPDGVGNYTLFKVDGVDLAGLYELVGPRFEGVPSHWASYVAVEDVDDVARRAVALGGQAMLQPMDVPGVGRIAFLRDPTGAAIGIARLDPHPGTAAEGPFGWSQLATRDPARAVAFYSELFNWKAKSDRDSPHTEFRVDDHSIAGMMPMTPQQGDIPAHWMPYVLVQDCDDIARKASAAGAHVLAPPMDIEHVGRFAVFADPTGAALAIIKLL